MGCPLPKVAGTLSSATALAWDDLDQTVSKLLHLDISPANFTNFGAAWAKTDSGTNVNVDGSGVLAMNGSAAYAANGMIHTAGVTVANGYFEFMVNAAAVNLTTAYLYASIMASAAFPTALTTSQNLGLTIYSSLMHARTGLGVIFGSGPAAASTWYTYRLYIEKSNDGSTYGKMTLSVTGGAFASETVIGKYEQSTVPASGTMYLTIQRYINNANLVSVKLPKWFSGYTTDGSSTTEFVHDAGAGKKFNNLDLTAFAMPAGMSSTNLKFAYYFAAAPAAYSAYYTLAELNALGKITGDYRYIGIKVQSNSDGATQVYAAKPNSDTAVDGIGDFPAVGDVRAAATVQGTAGTLANLAATDGAYVTLENSRNNDNGTVAADIATGKNVKIRNTTINGAAASDPAPAAPVITAAVYGVGKVRIKIVTAPDYTKTFTYYMDGAPIAGAGTETLATYYDVTGVSAASHTFKARANGVTSNVFSNEVTLNCALTPAEDDIWTAVKAVFAADTGIATLTTVAYNQAQVQPVLTTGQTSLQLYPLVVDPNSTKPALVIAGKLRTYRTSSWDSAESDLMTISRKFRECVNTIETEETWLDVAWWNERSKPVYGETQPDTGRATANAGYSEIEYYFRVGQV